MEVKQKVLAIIASLVAGILVSVMMRLNASLGGAIGMLESSFVVHVVGALTGILLIALFFRRDPLSALSQTQKYLPFVGVLGVLIVLCSNLSVSHLGLTLSVSLFLIGNLVFAMAADHFGFFDLSVLKISARRILGLACAISGVLLVKGL